MKINFFNKKSKPKKKILKSNKNFYITNKSSDNFRKRKKKYFIGLIRKIDISFKGKGLYTYYILASFLFFFIIFIIFGPILNIKEINIYRDDSITNVNIAYRAVEDIRGRNIFFLDKNEVTNLIKNYQKNIKDVKINIDFPNTLNINIGSYKEVFKTISNEKNYIVVRNGTFIPFKEKNDLVNINIINKEKDNIIPDYKEVIKPEYILKIEDLYKKLKENLLTVKIKNADLFLMERNLILELDNGTKLIFNLDGIIKSQVENLLILHQEHFNINKKKVVYIDLRIKNKIFFCSLEEEYQCKKNLKTIFPYNDLID